MPATRSLDRQVLSRGDLKFARAELLGRHLGYCISFELHRRKLFFADASLAWLLTHTSLDIEGRALRLPFPCFGMAFTDAATLDAAEALLQSEGGPLAGRPLKILTVYVKRIPARASRLGLSMSLVFDARAGAWPYLLERSLVFAEDDDMDTILDSRPGGRRSAGAPAAPRSPWQVPRP